MTLVQRKKEGVKDKLKREREQIRAIEQIIKHYCNNLQIAEIYTFISEHKSNVTFVDYSYLQNFESIIQIVC